jgi:hypothetical protein
MKKILGTVCEKLGSAIASKAGILVVVGVGVVCVGSLPPRPGFLKNAAAEKAHKMDQRGSAAATQNSSAPEMGR